MTTTPAIAEFCDLMSTNMSADRADVERLRALREGVLGWSGLGHYLVFRALLRAKPNASILVLGVYHGLDLRLLQGIADDLGQKVSLTGVDLFADASCADWPSDKKGLDWQTGAGCPPPDEADSRKNAPTATIVKGDIDHFLATTEDRFDVIYIDGPHDYESVRGEIVASRRILKDGGVLAGDDYKWGVETGGVDRAVQELLPNHTLWFKRIWVAQP